MFEPFVYAPRIVTKGRSPVGTAPSAPQRTAAEVEVPIPFTITTFPDVTWDDAPVTEDYFLFFPKDVAVQELVLGWSAEESSGLYSANMTAQLVQANGDGAVDPVIKEPVTFTRASMQTTLVIGSALPLVADYPVYLRLRCSASSDSNVTSALPSGPWWKTTGLKLYGTIHLLTTEVA